MLARLYQLVDQSGDARARSVRMNKTGSWSRQMGMEIATAVPEQLERENRHMNRGASLDEIEAVYLRDRLSFVRVAARIIEDPHEANDVVPAGTTAFA